MDRHHGRARAAQRHRVLRVDERGADPLEQPWQRPGHPELLRTRIERDRLDALGHEIRPARHRPDADAGVGRERPQLAQQVPHVGLVTRAPASERRRRRPRRAGRVLRSCPTTRSARRCHLATDCCNARTVARRSRELLPDGGQLVRGVLPGERPRALATGRDQLVPAARRQRVIPAAIESMSVGSTRTAAPPASSSIAPPALVTTGVPLAIASSTGSPKPS